MVRIWQDFDVNCKAMWGMWFGSYSRNGHVVYIVGPFDTFEECEKALPASHVYA